MTDTEPQENRFIDRLSKKDKNDEDKKKRIISGSGPLAQFIIFFLQNILYEKILKGLYNQFISVMDDAFTFVQNTFFSDFKGLLAGKLKPNKGICFEYTFFRYFMTLMLPPMGIFLSRGISGWYNIIICGLLCFIKYFPGLVYALIIMQSAPYSKRYQEMKRDKLAKSREEDNKKISAAEIQYTPLLMFVGAIFLTMLAVYISITSNPLQTAIGDPLNAFKNKFNNTFGIEKGHSVKGLISSEVKGKITSDLKTKAISKFI
jgi:uncharacterized membrane protein YqaE (UPF0057 family)